MDYQNRSNDAITDIGFKTCIMEDYNRTDQTREYFEEMYDLWHPALCLNNTDQLYLQNQNGDYKTQRAMFHIELLKCIGANCETN